MASCASRRTHPRVNVRIKHRDAHRRSRLRMSVNLSPLLHRASRENICALFEGGARGRNICGLLVNTLRTHAHGGSAWNARDTAYSSAAVALRIAGSIKRNETSFSALHAAEGSRKHKLSWRHIMRPYQHLISVARMLAAWRHISSLPQRLHLRITSMREHADISRSDARSARHATSSA